MSQLIDLQTVYQLGDVRPNTGELGGQLSERQRALDELREGGVFGSGQTDLLEHRFQAILD